MAELPEATPQLERFMARRMSGLGVEEWRGLGKEDRQAHVKKARQLLALERKFLARGPSTDDAEGGEADDGDADEI